ncbi:MAG: hypothetical protein R6W82_08870 [bacterium]
MRAFSFRELGPAVTGGRIHDVEAVPGDAATIYVGASSGGVWKSTNGGFDWTPLWDELPNSAVGDIALAPSDPEVLYVGTGGPNNRQSTLYGNGVWKSTDGGSTWTHLGLEETRHIGRIRVHPADPDIVYTAALGDLWAANPERGVFKTTDGGRSWEKVLYIDEDTGAVDLVMDPADGDVLYAAAYQRRRRTWGFDGGGPGSGIYRTTDGGRSWTELTDGIPAGEKGRIGLAISAADPQVLNATIEHRTEGGTYRTSDGGATWERVSRVNPRPMYYSHISIDPTDADVVYVLGTSSYRSTNGGRDFETLPSAQTYDVGMHADHHSIWIDPDQPDHIYLGGDAGLHVSWDGGISWDRINNFGIGQFYAIGADMREPYRVYGGMQDNHSWMGPSRTRRWIGIVNDDWRQVGFGDGMYTRPDPADPRRVYIDSNGGRITRVDSETGAIQSIDPVEPEGEEYRFDWTAPIEISPHDHRTIYLGGNRLFISRDEGASWTRTVDLTRQIDRDTLPIMGSPPGPETLSRHDGTSSYGEITTVDESALVKGLIWVGTDDGNVQVSRDGGLSWTEVSGRVPDVGDLTYVSRVQASRHQPMRAYLTFDAHRDGDRRPYVFVTEDLGESWERITRGLPETGPVNVIRESPRSEDLLFLGTEHALFMSIDRGERWMQIRNGLPTAPIDDLLIHPREDDLIVGTHGRSIWILDDISPLSQFEDAAAAEAVHLFRPRSGVQWQKWKATSYRGHAAYSAPPAPEGTYISYWLGEPLDEPVRVKVLTRDGRTVRHLEGGGEAGFHRVLWDLRLEPPPEDPDGGSGFRGGGREDPNMTPRLQQMLVDRGPFVMPGTYTVRLEAAGRTLTTGVEVRADPADPLSPSERQERWSFVWTAWQSHMDGFEEGLRARRLRDGVRSVGMDVAQAGEEDLGEELDGLEEDLTRVYEALWREVRRGTDRLLDGFSGGGIRYGTFEGPVEGDRETLARLEDRLEEAEGELERILGEEVPGLNRRLKAAGLQEIRPLSRR